MTQEQKEQAKWAERAKWSQRAGNMLNSIYWKKDVETEEELEEYIQQLDNEKTPIKEAVQAAESYDALSPAMKKMFDRAEKAQKDWDAFIAQDVDGYGRFHETITYTSGAPRTPKDKKSKDEKESEDDEEPEPDEDDASFGFLTDLFGRKHKGKGTPEGGQFTKKDGGGDSSGKAAPPEEPAEPLEPLGPLPSVLDNKAISTWIDGDKAETPIVEWSGNESNGKDTVLEDINREMGYDAKPKVISEEEMSTYIRDGGIELLRGVTEESHVEDYKRGEFWAGLGMYGNGTYTALPNLKVMGDYGYRTALNFADGQPGNVMRMSVAKDAKFASGNDTRAMRQRQRVGRS